MVNKKLMWSEIKPIAKKVFHNKKLTITEMNKWEKWWRLKKVM